MNRRITILAIVILLALLTAPTWFYDYFPRVDSGAYVMGAASLADGHAPRVLSHPMQPPATYPPVTMLLLTPAYLLTDGSDVAMRLTMALCWLAAMLLLAWHWQRDWRGSRLPGVLLLAGFSSIWLYVGRIQSEVPYLLVTVAALYAVERLKRDDRPFGGRWGPLALTLVILAGLTRQIGLMLALGAAAYLVWDRARLRRGAVLAVLFAVVGALPSVVLYAVTQPGQFSPEKSSVLRRNGWDPGQGQMSMLSREFAGRVKSNIQVSTQLASGAFFAMDFPPQRTAARAALVILTLLLIIGYVRQWIRGPTAAEFYVLFYTALLLVTPWLVETRFYTVLMPWLALYLILAVEWIAGGLLRDKRRAWIAGCAAAVVIAAAAMATALTYDFVDRWSQKENPEAAAYQWAKSLTTAEDVVLTRDPFALYVVTGRRAMSYTAGEQKYQPLYRLPGYLAAGGRLDAVLYPVVEREEVERRLTDAGLRMGDLQRHGRWAFGRLQQ